MIKKHKKVYKISNYTEHFLILAPANTGCVSTSAFGSLLGIPLGITSFVIGLKICVTTAAIKKYKSIVKEKNKLNCIELLISNILIDSYISHEFVSKIMRLKNMMI